MPQVWHVVRVTLPETLEDEAAACLHAHGSRGGQSRSEPPDRVILEGVYDDHRSARKGAAALTAFLAGFAWTAAPRLYEQPDEHWVERYEAGRSPLDMPGGFCVLSAPPVEVPREPDRFLMIPPGRAFGTGEHPTTRMVFGALVREVRAGRAVLDLGTGSGLLAMAAARLGASPVVAVERDPEAAAVATSNLRDNGLAGAVHLVAGEVDALANRSFDLVLANLYCRALEEVARAVACLQPPGGRAVLSGFGATEAVPVIRAWREAGYRPRGRQMEAGWVTLTLCREAGR